MEYTPAKHPRSVGFSLILLLSAIVVVPALMTYSPADFSADVWPHHETPQNIWGDAGASIAEPLFRGLGTGAWFVAFTLCVATGSSFMGGVGAISVLRLTGWLIALTGVCALCSVWALQIPWASGGPSIGPGGFLGVSVHAALLRYFSIQGVILVATGMIFGGVLICSDLPMTLLRGVWLLLTGKRLTHPDRKLTAEPLPGTSSESVGKGTLPETVDPGNRPLFTGVTG
ncbi:MAG: DNA translocase FtsK 4TM domain-containing protein, partial [Planctomycetia bacterium]|nr:DNA translocase FtsK 4TM domain-containing protein [Planctomycetia bacterium]